MYTFLIKNNENSLVLYNYFNIVCMLSLLSVITYSYCLSLQTKTVESRCLDSLGFFRNTIKYYKVQ